MFSFYFLNSPIVWKPGRSYDSMKNAYPLSRRPRLNLHSTTPCCGYSSLLYSSLSELFPPSFVQFASIFLPVCLLHVSQRFRRVSPPSRFSQEAGTSESRGLLLSRRQRRSLPCICANNVFGAYRLLFYSFHDPPPFFYKISTVISMSTLLSHCDS